jgi:PAS domain S-box-containing protein
LAAFYLFAGEMTMARTGTPLEKRYEHDVSRQIVLLLLAFSIFPMMLLTALVYTTDTAVLKEEIVQVQSEVAGRVAQTVDLQVQSSLNSLKLMSLSLDPEQDLVELRLCLSRFLFNQSEFDTLAVVLPDGVPSVQVSRLRTYHGEEKERFGGEPGFVSALRGQNGLGSILISPLSRFPRMRVYVPIRGKADSVVAVLCADASIAQIWRLVSKAFTGKDFTAYIVDREGVLIASDDLSAVLERKSVKGLGAVGLYLSGEQGVSEYVGIEGARVVGVVAETPLTGWGVVVETPVEMAYRHSRLLARVLIFASFSVIVFAGSCGWLFSVRTILRPIQALQQDVRIIATGNLTHRISVKGTGELGRLASDLSLMTENLRTLTVSREELLKENRKRKESEAALRENERRLTDILDFLPDATLAIDKDKRIIIWNRAIEEMTGVPSEEMLGEGDYAYTVPFYGERRPQMMDLIFEPNGRISAGYTGIKKEGQSLVAEAFCPAVYGGQGAWVFLKASPLHDQQGKVIGAIESIRDITDRKRTEDALEKRLIALTQPLDTAEGLEFEELFNIDQIQKLQDQFAEATGVASIITQPDGTPITRPSHFCRLCNGVIRRTEKGLKNCYRSDSVIGSHNEDGPIVQPCLSGGLWEAGASITVGGRHIASWLIGQVRNEAQDEGIMLAYAREIGADEKDFMEAFHEVPSMSREQFQKVAQALFTVAGQLSGMAYQNAQQARFITDFKRAEEEKEKLHRQLLQSQKMESVGRLAGGVAHDFNNMLGVIIGHADMALHYGAGHQIKDNLQEILKAAERSADLTRQLLAFARKQTISPKVLDVNETVEGILKMLRRLIGEDIELLWQPGPDLWPVLIDPTQIDQILANLCVNARDAIEGVGKVTIETGNVVFDDAYCREREGVAPGKYVMLAVSDDGCGMDKAVLSNLFEPFFTTKGVGKGTGLGLATVYGIVKQNNGLIDVYSEPDQGTTFRIYLQRSTAQSAEKIDCHQETKDPRGEETILLVEDEAAILGLGKAILERQGYLVLAAHNPAEALDLSRSHPGKIHLLVTDVVMPGMNGKELQETLLPQRPELKCMFMSGYTANVVVHHGVLDAGIHFLEKPFSVRTLAGKVREVLDT